MGRRNANGCGRESRVDTKGVGVRGQDGIEDRSGDQPTNTHRMGTRCLLGYVNVNAARATVILALVKSVAGDESAKVQGGRRVVAWSNLKMGRKWKETEVE